MHQQELTDKIVRFIRETGLEAEAVSLEEGTFLPGIRIDQGRLLYDPAKLQHPGDLLHEAGHLAVMPPEERGLTSGDIKTEEPDNFSGDEIAATLWSYAALRAIGLEPEIVFHQDGYRGASRWFIEQYENGIYMGLPLLVWMGLTQDASSGYPAAESFPYMQRWLRN